jgi:hypothetical protein
MQCVDSVLAEFLLKVEVLFTSSFENRTKVMHSVAS